MNKLFLIVLILLSSKYTINEDSNYDYSSYASKINHTHLKNSHLLDRYDITNNKTGESVIYLSENDFATPYSFSKDYIYKTGDLSDDKLEDSKLYGINSAVLIRKVGAEFIESLILTEAKGAPGLVCTDGGAATLKAEIYNTEVNTTEDNSTGIIANYNSLVTANAIVSTKGNSSPALAIYKGQGKIIADGSKLYTEGDESPLAYVYDGEISGGITGIASKSPCAVISKYGGLGCLLSNLHCGAGPYDKISQGGIIFYQTDEMTNDKKLANFSAFAMTDYYKLSEIEILESSPYYKTAPLFYVTNIGAAISLSGGVKLKYGSNIFLKVDEGIYGKKGSDGGVVMVILTQQEIEGDIIVSSNSVVDLYLVESKFKGKINTDKKGAAVNISLDEKSEITLTGNSYYTHLLNKDNTNSNIKKGSFQFDKYEARYIPNSPEEEKSSTDKPKENTLVEAEFLGYGGYKILNKTFFEFYLFFTNVDRSVLPKKFKIPFIANFNNNRRLRKLEPDVLECTLDENNKKISNYSCEGEVTDTSNIKNIGIDPTQITFVNLNVPPNADMNNIQNAKGNLFILSDSEYKTKEGNKFSISGTIENFPLANGDELYLTPNKGKSQVKCNVGEINLAGKKLTLDCDPNEKIVQSDLDNSVSTFGTDKHTLLIQFKENKGNDGRDDGEKDGEKTIRKHVKKSGGGLSAGGIVGIVLGSLAVLSGIFITFYCLKNSGLKRQEIPNASVVSAKV